MYLERTGSHLKIQEGIENLLIEGQIENLSTKGTLNALIVEKKDTLSQNVELNQRIELIIGILDFWNQNNQKAVVIQKQRK